MGVFSNNKSTISSTKGGVFANVLEEIKDREQKKTSEARKAFVEEEKGLYQEQTKAKEVNDALKNLTPAIDAVKQKSEESLMDKLGKGYRSVVDPLIAVSAGLEDTLSFGLLPKLREKFYPDTYSLQQKDIKEHPTAATIGEFAGYIAPGAAFSKGAGAVAKPILNKIGSNALKVGSQEAIAGLGMGLTEGTLRGDDAEELAKRTGSYAALGGVGGAALTKGAEVIGKGISKLKPARTVEEANQALRSLPTLEETIKPTSLSGQLSLKPASRPLKEVPISKSLEGIKGKLAPVNLQTFGTDVNEIGRTFNQSEVDKAFSKISFESPKKKTNFKEIYDKAQTQLIDDLYPLQKAEESITGQKIDKISAENSLYKQARLYRGVPERANAIVTNELQPIIKSVEDTGKSYKDLMLYADVVHARDLENAGIKSGFTKSEIENVIAKYSTPEMELARNQLVSYNQRRLRNLLQSGRISQESYNAMTDKWKNYMPFFRDMGDDVVGMGTGIKEKFANALNPIKKIKGSERDIINPLESIIKNTYKIEASSAQNNIATKLANLADKDTEGLIRKLEPNEPTAGLNVVTAYKNGEGVQLEVQPDLYKALLGLNEKASGVIVGALSKPASILRAGATLTPEFAIRNPLRDITSAYINTGFNPVTDFGKGLYSTLKKDTFYKQFLKDNAGYGNMLSTDRKVLYNAVKQITKQPNIKNIVNIINPKEWVKLMRTISDVTESATKVGEYRRLLAKGVSRDEAAYQARDLMDFARRGSSIKELNKVVAFLNANIQGKSKIIRAFQKDPVGVTTRLGIVTVLPTLAVYGLTELLANDKQKEIISDSPDWLRNTFWLMPVPNTDIVARIPKPFDLAHVINGFERSIDYFAKNDKQAFQNFIRNIIGESALPTMLTGLAPIIEGWTNKSAFRDYQPIIPQRESNLQAKDQQDVNTSELSKQLAAGVRVFTGEEASGGFSNFGSPRIVQNAITGLTAGLGKYGMNIYDFIAEGTGLAEQKTRPAKDITQQPLISAFTVNEMSTGKSLDFVYNEKDKITKERNSWKRNNPNKKFLKEDSYKYLNDITKQISEISTEIREITNSDKISADDKRDRIKILNDERNKIAIEARKKIK